MMYRVVRDIVAASPGFAAKSMSLWTTDKVKAERIRDELPDRTRIIEVQNADVPPEILERAGLAGKL